MMGKVIMSGIVPQLKAPPIPGILASDLAVGSSVYLMEGGTATEYLVVNKGKPGGSSMYDDSCDGLWLLRRYITVSYKWHNTYNNSYKDSDVHAYLNSDYLARFDDLAQAAIKQVKIPHVNGTGGSAVATGANGLSTKVFLLGGIEVGFAQSSAIPNDGVCLEYFNGAANATRIAYMFSGSNAKSWWIRSPENTNSAGVYQVSTYGTSSTGSTPGVSLGMRPAIVLPNRAVFDEETLILKGVA